MGWDFPRAIRRQRIANPLHRFHTQTMPRTTAPTGFFLAFVIALMLFATTPVAAGIYGDGEAAYSAGDYQKAFRLWKPLAERGVAQAQFNLGLMYDKGEGVPQDYASAALDPSSNRDYDFTNECALGNVGEMGHGWLYQSLGK